MKEIELKFRLDKRLKDDISAAASRQKITVSEAVRKALETYLENLPVIDDSEIQKNGLDGETRRIVTQNPKEELVFSVGELYSGPGGFALGAHHARWETPEKLIRFRHRFATDYDADTCQTYADNIKKFSEDCEVICADIRDLKVHDLPSVDGLIYGFPCNDFSIVGESKGLDGEFGPLYKYGVDYLVAHNPKFVVAENVSGISSANSGTAFKQILKELSEAGQYGYELTVHLYKFEEYEVPQARHRFIIVGIRKDLGKRFEVPAPSTRVVTSREAIEEPPIRSDAANNEVTKQSPQVIERLEHIGPGENAWSERVPEHLRLKVKGAKLSQIYKRLDPTKPSYTVTGSGGGGTHVYHWREPRALTNRERARLQTFDDSFVFFGSKESVRKQIGMAVPPKGASTILSALLATLVGEKYDSVVPSWGYVSSK